MFMLFFICKQKTAYGLRISDWSSDVCSSDLRKLPVDIQTARVIDVLRRAAEIYEPHGLVMVMEPLNTLVNHPGVFMSTVPQGYAVARAVAIGRASCRERWCR